jgi:RsiW-degrading membrane proteinase PrsW (M82 family)
LSDSIGKAYKPWIVLSVAVLVGSLVVLAVAMTFAFVHKGGTDTPVWVIVLAVVSGLGVALGFAGFFLLMVVAAWNAWREGRRVQVLSPRQE